ncbi:hypothetical protein CC117_02595 [Parafrankia colletiae]|uniref:Uncharacterized protein n=1 Tax=Parafrankia colletiae TaxID=573497 RepID=A0A1S1QYU7_9ACTN|nr:hypothetical protein CC117_02595 [Parafrankia colletiae]
MRARSAASASSSPSFRCAGRWFRLDRVRGATLAREQVAPRDMVETFGEPPADARPVHVD